MIIDSKILIMYTKINKSMKVILMMGYIIAVIVWGCIWGFATNKVIENKNYDENWFIWGFLFGFIAFIVACTKPENTSTYEMNYSFTEYSKEKNARREKDILNENGWKCNRCGQVNQSYTGTCSCGLSKLDNDKLNKRSEETPAKSNNTTENDNIEEIKKYKELLDSGIITQEEFEKKKKELLNI